MYIIISHFSRLAYETFELPFYRDWGEKHYGIMGQETGKFLLEKMRRKYESIFDSVKFCP